MSRSMSPESSLSRPRTVDRPGTRSATSSRRGRGVSAAASGQMTARRRVQLESARAAAVELATHFNHRNLEALTKVAKNTLENIKKRITSANVVHYGDCKHVSRTTCDIWHVKLIVLYYCIAVALVLFLCIKAYLHANLPLALRSLDFPFVV